MYTTAAFSLDSWQTERPADSCPQLNQSTTPLVGRKRVYNIPESFRVAGTKLPLSKSKPDARTCSTDAKLKQRTPRELLTSTMKVKKHRPRSAPAATMTGSIYRCVMMC